MSEEEVLRWALENGSVVEADLTGRQLVSKAHISPGRHCVLNVNRKLLVTARAAADDPVYGRFAARSARWFCATFRVVSGTIFELHGVV